METIAQIVVWVLLANLVGLVGLWVIAKRLTTSLEKTATVIELVHEDWLEYNARLIVITAQNMRASNDLLETTKVVRRESLRRQRQEDKDNGGDGDSCHGAPHQVSG